MARNKADGKTGRSRAAGSLGRVLLVEDDAILALATEQALRDAGADHVIICSTTAEALAALRGDRTDAMVLDVHLADRDDGWAIAELVSEVGPHPPRIVFSTGAPDDIPDEIAELGPVLVKPYDSSELVALLRKPPRESLLARLREALNP
jgi:CheY-like chemotaxis protein